jgi:hypothetical protein
MDQAMPSVRLLVADYPLCCTGSTGQFIGIVGRQSGTRTVLSLGQPLYPVSVPHSNLRIQSFP